MRIRASNRPIVCVRASVAWPLDARPERKKNGEKKQKIYLINFFVVFDV